MLKSIKWIFQAICILNFVHVPVLASEDILPPVIVFHTLQNNQATKVAWKYKSAPLWEINSDGAYEFFWGVNLQLPAPAPILNVQAQESVIGFSKDGEVSRQGTVSLFIKMTTISDELIVAFKNGSRLQFKLEAKSGRPQIITEGCDDHSLVVKSKLPNQDPAKGIGQVPGYLAYRCDKIDTGLTLSISVPGETKWKSNSIFESKGKGKRWKTFELNTQAPQSGRSEVGEIVFESNQKEFPYLIILDKSEVARKIAKFRLALGLVSLAIKTDTDQDAMAKPAAHVAFEIRPWRPEFAIGGEGISSLPSVSKSNYFTHTESVGYLGYTFGLEKRFSIEPRLYGYMADGISQKLQFFYTVNIFAVGGELKYKLTTKTATSLEAFYMSSANQSVMSLRATWGTSKPNGAGWGIVGTFSQVGVNLKESTKGYSTQTLVGPYIDF